VKRPGGALQRLRDRWWSAARADDRGSAAAELVVLTVVSFVFVSVVIFAGKMNVSSAHVEAAARSAARTISLARNPDSAVDEAQDQASNIVNEGSEFCTAMGFDYAIGDEQVTVDITCTVDLSEATLAELPGSLTVTADATESIDRYRERT
jgi:Flp pilus assembly protein TadG